jgi:hypothetical protein
MMRTMLACAAVLACAVLAAADDKKDDKGLPALSGVWERTGGEPKIEFSGKDVLKVWPHGDKAAIVIVCSYKVEKGVVKAKVTDLEATEEVKEKLKAHVPVGLVFRFTWQVKDDTATVDDVRGDKTEVLKAHLEGKYDKK